MKVSVALAVYNGERYLKKQLDSLLKQTRSPDEVIIIDDCSTDGSAAICRAFISANRLPWRLSVSEKNVGYKRNFYHCLKQCTGDIVFLCDQDDEWAAQKIEKMTALMESDPDCMAVNTAFTPIDADSRPLSLVLKKGKNSANHGLIRYRIPEGAAAEISRETISVYNISPGCTCAFRRKTVERYLGTTRCVMPHDWELNMIAAQEGKLIFYNLPLTGYRLHTGNTIGLKSGGGALKMQGSEEDRLAVWEMQNAHADMVSAKADGLNNRGKRFIRRFCRFTENRRKILFEKRFFPCLKNLLLYPCVREVATVRFRSLIGDMIYVLRKKKT